jgi:hypothetical protein
MIGTLKKVRSASLVKFRTLFIDKDLNIWVIHSHTK